MAERNLNNILSNVESSWKPLPSPYPEMTLWYAIGEGGWQYVLSYDAKHPGWIVSAKTIGVNVPFTTPRYDLGVFPTREQAEQAVRKHQRKISQ